MSEGREPWWYSGDAEQRESGQSGQSQAHRPPGLDWSSVVTGAQRLVDWASSAILAPHSGHEDPREHPQCLVCRTIQMTGERRSAPASGQPPRPVEWIPIDE